MKLNRNCDRSMKEAIELLTGTLNTMLKGVSKLCTREGGTKLYSELTRRICLPDLAIVRERIDNIFPQIEAIVEKYKKLNKNQMDEQSFNRPSKDEYLKVMRYILVWFSHMHCQRPDDCR